MHINKIRVLGVLERVVAPQLAGTGQLVLAIAGLYTLHLHFGPEYRTEALKVLKTD